MQIRIAPLRSAVALPPVVPDNQNATGPATSGHLAQGHTFHGGLCPEA
jgi:hypothetical protein